ncbi:hypothetical protein EDC96DRAFT_581640 [Choanephora cucurbitarum]|nr:hypothetical protein EDC96DRAFT_581640 [Choanephora cucurbitarum]
MPLLSAQVVQELRKSVLTSFGVAEALNSSDTSHNFEEETVSSGLLIFRPSLSNESTNSKNNIDMKIKYFVTQWLGDQVVVQESDLSFVREEKESKVEMYTMMLYQLSRIPTTKMILRWRRQKKIGKNYLYKNFFKNQRKSSIISSCFGSSKQNPHYKVPQFLVGELAACLPLPQQGKAFKGKVAAITTTTTTAITTTITTATITTKITTAIITATITTITTITITTTTITTTTIKRKFDVGSPTVAAATTAATTTTTTTTTTSGNKKTKELSACHAIAIQELPIVNHFTSTHVVVSIHHHFNDYDLDSLSFLFSELTKEQPRYQTL